MFKKKICMLGAFATGKTSLVRRFVFSLFSDRYKTSVGVKIDKKSVFVGKTGVDLILWDLYGEDEFQEVRSSYLRGASGCLLVVDGTRKKTLDTALKLRGKVQDTLGGLPVIFIFNKDDLKDEWEIGNDAVKTLEDEGAVVQLTSAKTGQGVEDAFITLAKMMLED